MKITKEIIKEFINTVPLNVYYSGNRVMTVGIQWGYCKETDESYGRRTVLEILDLLENDKEYQKLLG